MLIVRAVDAAGATTARDMREFIYWMRLYCGGTTGLAGNTVYFPASILRSFAGMLAGLYSVQGSTIY